MRIAGVVLSLGLAIAALSPAQAQEAQPTLNHISLHVANVAKSVTFYSDVLGLKELPSQVPNRRWFALGGGAEIHLGGGRTALVPNDEDVHFPLAVRDLNPWMARLKAHGIHWVGAHDTPFGVSTIRTDGVRQIYFRDPDGYWIEINDELRLTH